MFFKHELILVTGGAGYVGSHTVLQLLKAEYRVVVVDNVASSSPGNDNSMPEILLRVQKLAGKELTFYQVDLLNKDALIEIFEKHKFSCVIHFPTLKAAEESYRRRLDYYRTTVGGTVNLLEVMEQFHLKKMVFSSSATVYGVPKYLPVNERHPGDPTFKNHYGRTKYFIEEILKDVCKSDENLFIAILRCFKPLGAHESGTIGKDPREYPNSLMSHILEVAERRMPLLRVFGGDYKTCDGTVVRDYIHVMDLAENHLAAMKIVLYCDRQGLLVYNVGSGQGFSVLQVLKAFEDANGIKIPYRIVRRRKGDVESIYANIALAASHLCLRANRSLKEMCADTWRWHSNNPRAFDKTV